MIKLGDLILLLFILLSMDQSLAGQQEEIENYYLELKSWHKARTQDLKSVDGWFTVQGLFWLRKGDNRIGSGMRNDLVFPKNAPEFWGNIRLQKDTAHFLPNEGLGPANKGYQVTFLDYMTFPPTSISYKNLTWHLLKRGEKIGVRLRDTLHPERFSFDSVPYFTINPTWKMPAKFIASSETDSIQINNVLGMRFSRRPAGYIDINLEGQIYRLSVLDAGNKYMLIFSDGTTGMETYGGGRYLYIEKPKDGLNFYIDFDKAENPPCAFTAFATCLLPPRENKLPFRVEAGELNYHHH